MMAVIRMLYLARRAKAAEETKFESLQTRVRAKASPKVALRNGVRLDEVRHGSRRGWNLDWTSPSSCSGLDTEEISSTKDVRMATSELWKDREELESLETPSGRSLRMEVSAQLAE